MSLGHFERGEKKNCICGSPWKRHCERPGCRWLRCSRKRCSGLYDAIKRRFWCFERDLPEAA